MVGEMPSINPDDLVEKSGPDKGRIKDIELAQIGAMAGEKFRNDPKYSFDDINEWGEKAILKGMNDEVERRAESLVPNADQEVKEELGFEAMDAFRKTHIREAKAAAARDNAEAERIRKELRGETNSTQDSQSATTTNEAQEQAENEPSLLELSDLSDFYSNRDHEISENERASGNERAANRKFDSAHGWGDISNELIRLSDKSDIKTIADAIQHLGRRIELLEQGKISEYQEKQISIAKETLKFLETNKDGKGLKRVDFLRFQEGIQSKP